jgi:hypothetical protein
MSPRNVSNKQVRDLQRVTSGGSSSAGALRLPSVGECASLDYGVAVRSAPPARRDRHADVAVDTPAQTAHHLFGQHTDAVAKTSRGIAGKEGISR